jgi:hypothetical protein
MYRHDYILKLIERFGAALLSLRDRILRRVREEQPVTSEIHEIARHAGLDLAIARSLAPDSLLIWLAPGGEPDPAKLWLMAELLYLEGLESKLSGRTGWRGDFERALFLLRELPAGWRPGEALAAADLRASEIRTALNGADEST